MFAPSHTFSVAPWEEHPYQGALIILPSPCKSNGREFPTQFRTTQEQKNQNTSYSMQFNHGGVRISAGGHAKQILDAQECIFDQLGGDKIRKRWEKMSKAKAAAMLPASRSNHVPS
jgi:hypothetical protein